MNRIGLARAFVWLLVVVGAACGQSGGDGEAAPREPAKAAEAPTPTKAADAPAPTKAPDAPAPTADGGAVAAGGGNTLGPFEPSGEPLPLPGLTMPAEGARKYVPLGVAWPVVSALLDATPGLRVRDHVGFYPPRPIGITGRPAPYTFGHVNALSRPGTWKPAPDATFVLVPFHHTEPSLAIYAPAGEGTVRFVTRVERVECAEEDHEIGFLVTRAGDAIQVLRTCGAEAQVTTFRAEGGHLVGHVESVDPAAVRVAGEEQGDRSDR